MEDGGEGELPVGLALTGAPTCLIPVRSVRDSGESLIVQ
jgi:hypothetical protein